MRLNKLYRLYYDQNGNAVKLITYREREVIILAVRIKRAINGFIMEFGRRARDFKNDRGSLTNWNFEIN